MEARDLAGAELASSLLSDVVGCYLAVGDMPSAAALAREELAANGKFPHPIETPIAVLHVAALSDDVEPLAAARLSGHAQAELRAAGWQLQAAEDEILSALQRRLADRLSEEDLSRALAAGAAMSRDDALADSARLINAKT